MECSCVGGWVGVGVRVLLAGPSGKDGGLSSPQVSSCVQSVGGQRRRLHDLMRSQDVRMFVGQTKAGLVNHTISAHSVASIFESSGSLCSTVQ